MQYLILMTSQIFIYDIKFVKLVFLVQMLSYTFSMYLR